MNSPTKNVPKLRFPSFSDDWKEKKLGDFLSFKNGVNASKDQYGQGYKFINVLDIIENNYITHDKIRGKVDIGEDEYKKNKVSYGDILFQRSSETREDVGQVSVYLDKKKSATFGGFVIRGQKIANHNPSFLNKLLKTTSVRKDITSRSGGSTRYNIGQESLEKVSIVIPTQSAEQKKITEFLDSMDLWIENLKKQKENLEQYKKGMVQKLFSQEIRFKDENGKDFSDWEKKKLEDIAIFLKGTGLSKSDIVAGGQNKCIRYGELYTTYNEAITKVHSRTNISTENMATSRKHDLLIPSSGETPLDIATVSCVSEEGVIIGGDINIIRLSENNHGLYFSYYLSSFCKIAIARLSQGVSVVHLYSSHFRHLQILTPSYKEQEKIANFLILLDDIINLKNQQLEKAQEWKKGLIQNLFV